MWLFKKDNLKESRFRKQFSIQQEDDPKQKVM